MARSGLFGSGPSLSAQPKPTQPQRQQFGSFMGGGRRQDLFDVFRQQRQQRLDVQAGRNLIKERAGKGILDRPALIEGINPDLLPMISQGSDVKQIFKQVAASEADQAERARLAKMVSLGLLGPQTAGGFGAPQTAQARLLGS